MEQLWLGGIERMQSSWWKQTEQKTNSGRNSVNERAIVSQKNI